MGTRKLNPSAAEAQVALAHSKSKDGSRADTLADHLESVASRAAEYASAFGAADEARVAGLLHDLGKYGELFQRRLAGEAHGIDHWSSGAWHALTNYRQHGIAAALAIQGHHLGLQQAERDRLASLNPATWTEKHPSGPRLSETNQEVLVQRLQADGLALAESLSSLYDYQARRAAAMLDIRMLFSALVDADFIETEAHFQAQNDLKRYREPCPDMEPAKALEALNAYIVTLSKNSQASCEVSRLRADLRQACLVAATWPQGLFTLTAPTGTGKTLSMLAFALKHAVHHSLRRIVLVIPYLNIIEQTVGEYKKVFGKDFPDCYVLEHHSLAGTRNKDDNIKENDSAKQDGVDDQQRLLAENWDAPIIITTSVQFFESLFANRPRACRKLHRLAQSVIMFDEAQTFPARLAVPTLATLSRLVERYHASIVFATATQPAFRHLDEPVRKYCACGWQPQEIVPPRLNLFDRARRTTVEWPDLESRTSWDVLAARLRECPKVMCVVNLKRHAAELFRRLRALGISDEELFHLSTNMCPAHRTIELGKVRERLERGQFCRLISTQCVEAGVDIDFPVVYRAWGPLDSIAQAAGRCNRNGVAKQPGSVHIFLPEEERYPDSSYQQAAGVARAILAGRSPPPDIHDPSLFEAYYRELFDLSKPENMSPELMDAIQRQDFAEVARLYRIIPNDTINVLVPYDIGALRQLTKRAKEKGITRKWLADARPLAIGIFRPRHDELIRDWLAPVSDGRGGFSEEWFEYLNDDDYDGKLGLVLPESRQRSLIA